MESAPARLRAQYTESLIVEHGYVRGVINATMFHLQARRNVSSGNHPAGAQQSARLGFAPLLADARLSRRAQPGHARRHVPPLRTVWSKATC